MASLEPPLARCPLCIHRINGNTALHRDIYPSVSLQIQKNFAKSKWRVRSSPGGGQSVCAPRLGWGSWGGGSPRAFPADAGAPWTLSGMKSGLSRRPRGKGKAGPVSPQQAFNAAAVVHHMRKLHMNLHSPGGRPEVENRPPVTRASDASRPSTPEITITEAPALDQSVALPALPRLPCQHGPRPTAPGGRSLNCLVNGSLRISSSLVPMEQGRLATGPCGCCSSCLSVETKGKSSYCSEPTLLKKAKKQYVFSAKARGPTQPQPGSEIGQRASPTGGSSGGGRALGWGGVGWGVKGNASGPVPTPQWLCDFSFAHL